MTDSPPQKRKLPSDIQQIFTVARYEFLKHLRSRRLIGTIVVVLAIVSLIYALPPLLGQPYTGHVDQTLNVQQISPQLLLFILDPNSTIELPGGISLANITYDSLGRVGIVEDSIHVSIDGVQISDSAWIYMRDFNSVVFFQNYTANDVVASFDFKRSTDSFTENFLSFAPFLVIICAIFFGADAIVSEYQNRTAYLLFPNPVRREVTFFGKMAASFGASLLMVGLFYLVLLILSVGTLGDMSKYLWLSFIFAALYLLACLGLAYFISSVMKGSTGAIILTFFLLFMIFPIISGVGQFAGAKMWFLLDFVGNSIGTSLRYDNYPEDQYFEIGGIGLYNYYPDLGLSAIVMIAYLIILSIISLILFKRKQLTG